MSNVHIEFELDDEGDVVDMLYYHHACAPDDVPGWPCPEGTDYPVACEDCGLTINEVPLNAQSQ